MVEQDGGRLAVAVPETRGARPAPPGSPPSGGKRRALRPWQLRNWRVRWRVLALVLIPTLAAVALGGARVQAARDTSAAAGRTGQLGTLGTNLTTLVESLEDERDLTAGYVAAKLSGDTGQTRSLLGKVQAQEEITDRQTSVVQAAIGQIGSAFPAVATEDLATVQGSLGAITELRVLAGTLPGPMEPSQMSALPLVIRYSNLIATMLEFDNDIAAGSSNATLAQTVTSFAALAQAQEDASQQRALVFSALQAGTFETGALSAVTAAQSNQQSVTTTYQKVSANLPSYVPGTGLTASLTQTQQFSNTVTGPQIDLATQAENDAIDASSLGEPIGQGATAAGQWFTNMTFTLGQLRQVEQDELSSIAVQATATQAGAQSSAELTSIIVIVVILLVLIATVVMARSMIIPLRKLRADALDVADHRLPAMVRRLSQEAASESIQIEPIGIDSTDEIGEVARAFDQVHSEAARLAGDEAMLRANLNAMFVNLSRRSQTLIERQLGIIESLEQSEQDASRLSSLFRLDHLATRMRRNSENLLVLAGHEAPRKWTQPVVLVDVLRAAVSEIEQYDRITLNVQSRLVIAGRAASDVVHLVAELVENATTFSRKGTQVFVTGQLIGSGGVLVEITDEGLGIPEQELAYANWRLDNPPVIDVAVSRRMGLFVVGRLAARHGIKVRLRRAPSGGLSALIWVPETVAETEPTSPVGSRRFGTGGNPVLISGPASAVMGARTPVIGVRTVARPKSIWFDIGEEEQDPAPGTEQGPPAPVMPAPTAPVVAAAANAPVGGVPAAAEPEPAADDASGVRLPIYDSIESEWFRRGTTSFSGGGGPAGSWTSPADEGFRAAQTVVSPVAGQLTNAGLPQRVPSANLVPGSISARPPSQRAGQAPPRADGPSRTPAAVRARLTGFQVRGREGRSDPPSAGTDEN
ncbi:MAG TPA: nitrate- and nitrite sensing domain-containing protein [Trebonia sp.]|jgi:signal transduction histidine kinase|nr:nitrate- and nitrite sensing domain-containing protein [Trebonia sp.]